MKNLETRLIVHNIDAWRDSMGGWSYNSSYECGEIRVKGMPTARKLCATLRKQGYLKQSSAGKLTVDQNFACDGFWTVCRKGNAEPLYDLQEVV